jgi:predicted nucleotidyltransferase
MPESAIKTGGLPVPEGRVICEVIMTNINDSVISQMTECIVKEVDPVRIILFGSSARGNTHEDSDIDLLVIEDVPFGEGRSRFRETGRINRALAGFGVAKDVLVYSIDEVERWRNSLNHVISHALREGRELYVRP